MAFCPECGKAVTPDATRCPQCDHELPASAGKAAGGRFKGTMMMQAPAGLTKPVATPAATAPAAPAAPARTAAPAPAAPASAQAPAVPIAKKPAAAKGTMIGTGIQPPVANPATAPTAPTAAARPAIAAAPAAAAIADTDPPPAAAEPSRNLAFAQTQHQASFSLGATPAAPAPAAAPVRAASVELAEAPSDAEAAADERRYLPGDPMAPQPTAARAPVLRYDDSLPNLPKQNPLADKKWLLIAASAIALVCLGLIIILASKLSN